MCPNCRAFITTSDRLCPYCDAPVGPRAIDVRDPAPALGGLIPHAHFTTVLILLINAGLYVATAVYASQSGRGGGFLDIDIYTLFFFGAKVKEYILAGQWWRLITAGFLHGGILHIGMNLWVLYDLGARVEESFGTARFLVIYAISGITGYLASMWWTPALSVGASASLFGLIGAMIALLTKSNRFSDRAQRSGYIQWAVYMFALGLLPGLRVDNFAHLGGLAGGFAIGYIAGTPRAGGAAETLWKALAGICVLVTIYAVIQAVLFMLRFGSQS